MSTEGEFQCANQLVAAVHDFKIGVNIKCQVTTLPHSIKKKGPNLEQGRRPDSLLTSSDYKHVHNHSICRESYFLNWKVFLII